MGKVSPSAVLRAQLGALACAMLAGCAGGAAHLKADRLSHPVSLSRSYFASDGSVVGPDRQETVNDFSFVVRRWSLLWTLLPLSSRQVDLSDRLEHEIRAAGGDAIVNLTFRVSEDPLAWFTLLLPLLPSRVPVEVEGRIVRTKGAG